MAISILHNLFHISLERVVLQCYEIFVWFLIGAYLLANEMVP
jgi:hypothetical protein